MATDYKPIVSADKNIPEFTLGPIIVGVLLGILFGASSLYLALKVGMTVSASIPIAVMSITLFKFFSKRFGLRQATILENNIVQTVGSGGESIAFGVAVTMPALLILGYDMDLFRTMAVAVLGGLLGVLMMIPLRWALIVKGHKELAYPEGTACAEVLIVGEKGGTSAQTVFLGFFVGLFYKFANVVLRLWTDVPSKAISWFKGASVSAEVSPELLGVGYIIGPRIGGIMMAGGVVSSLVFIPMIKLFGESLTAPLFPGTKLISQMAEHEIWRAYVLYIGAGAVAAGGLISLVGSLPTIIHGAKAGLASLGHGSGADRSIRTERDVPLPYVGLGILAIVLAIWILPTFNLNLMGAILIVVFGFLFVTVSSRLTGEIGSSSNPISGMTVATLLITSLIFLALGWVGLEYRLTALCVAAVVCIAASNGGTTSQDLKTGFLVGATPRAQQIGLLIGSMISALFIGYTLNLLNDASTVYSKNNLHDVSVSVSELSNEREAVRDPVYASDTTLYRAFRLNETPKTGPLSPLAPGKYLADDLGKLKYFVDPGINGGLKTRDDGTHVTKYEAPKARLMSLIIDGILTQKLPWTLVLLGVFIAVTMELCGVSSLPFAVGVYLPMSASTPIFLGGVVRFFVSRKTNAGKTKTSTEEEESGPGILLSSGLIAGGSIAGIGVALLSLKSAWLEKIDIGAKFPALLECNVTPCIVFGAMMLMLFVVGRKKAR